MGDRGVEREGLGVAPASQPPGQRPFGVEPVPVSSKAATPNAGRYLLMKRGLYYRPDSHGYTGIKEHAGRYDESDARPDSGVQAIHEDEAPAFSPACFEDLARAHLESKVTILRDALTTTHQIISAFAMSGFTDPEIGMQLYTNQGRIFKALASAAGARSAETAQQAQSEGRQSGDAKQRDAQPSRSREP